MRIDVAGQTHVGMKRTQNEDSFLMMPEEGLFCVADGMGGHSSGEIASKMAVDELSDFFRMTGKDSDATWPFKMDKDKNYDENRLVTGIKLANVRIYERQVNESRLKGMGTTLAAVFTVGNQAYIAHVGDSRVYMLRRGELLQLTEDHSYLNDVLKSKKLTAAEIESFPKNIIMRALGQGTTVQVDVSRHDLNAGDTLLICSDGLSSMIDDAAICQVLVRTKDLEKACAQLIDLANGAGGSDNVTCIVAAVHAEET